MSIGFLEPHLRPVGGIRRVVETGNRLVERGHRVAIYLPDEVAAAGCDWMRCLPALRRIDDGGQDPLDFLIFNHEPQWYLLRRFERARRTVFLALSYSKAYEKSGSWESLRCAVDLRLANSRWTAESIRDEIGTAPHVVPTGVDQELFRPLGLDPEYPVLCAGDPRPWKGTALIEEACEILDLPLAKLADSNSPQAALPAAFSRAEVFAVGSPVEGFGFPGLEAMACGTPLVTTDNGGCREYAVHEDNALIVPPGDPAAMAQAIHRVRSDARLRHRLTRNGLATARRFTWDAAALGLEAVLARTHEQGPSLRRERGATLREPEEAPLLSVVVLSWNHLDLTQRCIESIRQNTDVPYELILVDNGSQDNTADYVAQAADHAILNSENGGFSRGFNQGLACARGEFVAFINNDTRLPPGWASRIAATLERHTTAGIVFPALTAAANPLTVRAHPRDSVEVLPPFMEPASGVALVMRTSVMRQLGGWGEEYSVASGEDTDLCFKVWVNGMTTLLDEGVLIDHVGKASAKMLPNWERTWAANRALFLAKWTGSLEDVPRTPDCPPELFEQNKAHARGVAFWMQRYFRQRDSAILRGDAPAKGSGPAQAALTARPRPPGPAWWARMVAAFARAPARRLWRSVRPLVPDDARVGLYRRFRREHELLFPERQPAPRPAAAAVAAREPAKRPPEARVVSRDR